MINIVFIAMGMISYLVFMLIKNQIIAGISDSTIYLWGLISIAGTIFLLTGLLNLLCKFYLRLTKSSVKNNEEE